MKRGGQRARAARLAGTAAKGRPRPRVAVPAASRVRLARLRTRPAPSAVQAPRAGREALKRSHVVRATTQTQTSRSSAPSAPRGNSSLQPGKLRAMSAQRVASARGARLHPRHAKPAHLATSQASPCSTSAGAQQSCPPADPTHATPRRRSFAAPCLLVTYTPSPFQVSALRYPCAAPATPGTTARSARRSRHRACQADTSTRRARRRARFAHRGPSRGARGRLIAWPASRADTAREAAPGRRSVPLARTMTCGGSRTLRSARAAPRATRAPSAQ